VANVNWVARIQSYHQLGKVVGIGVQGITIPRLVRATVSSAIVRDAAISTRSQTYHLFSKASPISGQP